MEATTEAGVLLAALLAGILGSMLGLGGGVFIVPILSAFFGVPLKTAIAASAVSVVVNSLSGSTIYLRHRLTNVRLGLLLFVTTTIGAIIGGLLAIYSSPTILRIVFSVSLLAMSAAMLRGPIAEKRRVVAPDPYGVSGSYFDPSINEQVNYTPQKIGIGMAISSFAGVISGMLGIGGGAIQVPVMNAIMRVPVKAAAATSVYMVGTTVVASAIIYYANDLIDPSITVPAVLGVLIGAQAGSRLARRARSAVLVRMLIVILIYLAITVFLQAVGINPPGTR